MRTGTLTQEAGPRGRSTEQVPAKMRRLISGVTLEQLGRCLSGGAAKLVRKQLNI